MDLKFSPGDFLTGVCSCLEESVFYFVPNRDFGPDGGSRMETGALVYNLCDSSGIYHGNDRESVAWMECMGLYRKKMAAVRSDLSAVYHYFFRTVRDRHSALRVSSLLVIRGRKTTFSRALGSWKADKIGSGTLN